VETFEEPLLKTKGILASNALNCEGWDSLFLAISGWVAGEARYSAAE